MVERCHGVVEMVKGCRDWGRVEAVIGDGGEEMSWSGGDGKGL